MDLMSLLGRSGYLPHGYCFTWQPGLLWTMVASDAAIAAAYFTIPLGILTYLRRRPEPMLTSVAVLFSAFIFACGITHVLDIWTIWQPDYGLQAIGKAVTAVVSGVTAVAVWRLMPLALRIPHRGELEAVITELEREVRRRKSVEEQVADVEQNLALTLASIDAGLITTDIAGNVVRLNAVAERVTGWLQEEAEGRPYWDVIQFEDGPRQPGGQSVVEVIRDRGLTVGTAHRVVAQSRQGRRTPVEINAALTRTEEGAIRGALVVIKDMTRMSRAEEDVQRLAAIVESSSDAIISKTLDGRITSWNRAATQLFGYTAAEAVGQSVRMLVPPDRLAEEKDILANIMDGRLVPAFDTIRLAKGGQRLDLSVTISPIRDGRGHIVGESKIARDISERRRTLAALSESDARLNFALEVAQIGDWDLDLRTGDIHRSIRHDRCFGYAELQPEWSITIFLTHVHPDERDQVAFSYRRALLQAQDWDAECRVVWPDASVHWIHIQGSTRYETGHSERMLGIVSDVTQHKLAESRRLLTQQLENENRQIMESNRLKSQFLANMSHELRSPLNAIIGFSDLLYADGAPIEAAKQHQFIGHIRTSGRHLLQLINDVLDLSKVESGKFEFYPEPVDLTQVIAEVNGVLYTQFQRKRLQVSVSVDAAVNAVVIDPSRLKQALYNYLSNAIKFTGEGGLVAVRVRPERDGYFLLEVEDTGAGISEADLPRLFVEFQQLDESYTKRHQGTGLGLSLTRRMVEAQGGAVGVRSVFGQGSTFFLVLPVTPGAGMAVTDGLAPAPGGEALPRWLVIEDDVGDQALIVDALVSSGHEVDVAGDGDEALQRASERGYDALSLDLSLGHSGGLEVLGRIRRESRNVGSPVVMLKLDVRPSGTAAFSIADVLTKPLRVDEVVAALRRFGLRPQRGARIVIVDDDPLALKLMGAQLGEQGFESVGFVDGREALTQLDLQAPVAIILDLLMPGLSGFDVLDTLRSMDRWRELPVFVWTSMELSDTEYDLLALSAAAVLRKGGGGLEPLLERLRRWRPARFDMEGEAL